MYEFKVNVVLYNMFFKSLHDFLFFRVKKEEKKVDGTLVEEERYFCYISQSNLDS